MELKLKDKKAALKESSQEDRRYERKFLIEEQNTNSTIQLIKSHPLGFREIYTERIINNIYFDTLDFENYWDNVNGLPDRTKIRIRWYGDIFGQINRPVLEVKRKFGLVGTKSNYPLQSLLLKKGFGKPEVENCFRKSDLPENIRLALNKNHPALLNTYSRRYFQSRDQKFRITLDKSMKYYSMSSHKNLFLNKIDEFGLLILELKYHHANQQFADQVSTAFPFRLSKSSKYISGIQKTKLSLFN